MQNQQLTAIGEYSKDQVQVLKDTIAKGCTDSELKLFVTYCQRTKLDPFSKQIYAIVRGGKMTIQAAIDGLRIIAERSGKFGGPVAPQWCGPDGKWEDVWLKEEAPAAARVGVIRTDWKEPVFAIARYKAYAQKDMNGSITSMWSKMDAEQLAKCAEALALRKAFPNDLSGIYSEDEMQQAGTGDVIDATVKETEEPAKPQELPIQADTLAKIKGYGEALGASELDLDSTTQKIFGGKKLAELAESQGLRFVEALEKKILAAAANAQATLKDAPQAPDAAPEVKEEPKAPEPSPAPTAPVKAEPVIGEDVEAHAQPKQAEIVPPDTEVTLDEINASMGEPAK